MLVVFGVVIAALVLFATEPVPVDITAIGVMVALMLAGPVSGLFYPDPLVDISPELGVSGFSSPATITVLAMFVLSDGVQRTGIIQVLGHWVGELTGENEFRQLFATIGLVGPISGFINNTAAVAILLPMVNDLAHRGRTSPSKLLIPLSYASMFGGMLTVIGTSTNILASDLADRFLGEPFSMFEFTLLGATVSVVGAIYLLTVSRWLLPERIPPQADLTEEFQLTDYLTEVVVRDDSPIVGQTVREALGMSPLDVDILQLVRGESRILEPLGPRTIRAGDVFTIRTDRDTLVELIDIE
ncbi:MAG: SLC13 family permease, partial [Halobacteriales archaeon]|nr:SLC13 family permease [Halobacteriales archaeon]